MKTGVALAGDFMSLGEVKQAGGKRVKAWALRRDIDPATLQSNTFEMEWPPRSGKIRSFPEVDSWAWFPLETATSKINMAQREFLTRLSALLE